MLSLILYPVKLFLKIFLILALIVVIYLHIGLSSTSLDTKEISLDQEKFDVYLVDDDIERAKGLSDQKKYTKGMLFVYEENGNHQIWMKDMFFDIDIIWLNEDREVVHIERDARKDSYPTIFSSPKKSRYVLEMKSGFAEQVGLELGDRFEF